jgi:hypothetical protein
MFRPRPLTMTLALLCAPATASAQAADLFARGTLHGVAEVRLGGADGERGWLDGGHGKTGLSDGAELKVPRAAIEWTPSLGVSWRAHVTVQYQPEASPDLDLNEAFVQYRAPPSALGRLSVKGGVFYPPVSLEHTGRTWTTPDTLSASAINSWIGEEVLVGGVEATLRRELAGHEVSATAAVFGWNDTSGTLLSFRGWALHGLTTGAGTEWPLPPLSPFMSFRQGPFTKPRLELDNRAGYYGRLEWRPPAPLAIDALFYDNAGDRIAVDSDVQWAWETRFLNVGVRWEPADGWTVLAQAMNGETLMGYRERGQIWVDVGYRSAYLMAQRRLGDDTLSVRLDGFRTTDRTLEDLDDNDEDGWAATLAYRHRLAAHLDLIVEAQHVESGRDYRAYAGLPLDQDQTALQAALRFSF